MKVQPVFKPTTAQPETADPLQAARALGELLGRTPELRAYLNALKAVNHDPAVRKLSAQMRACQSAIQWGKDVARNAAESERLEAELEALPVIQSYHKDEAAIRRILLAVDEIVSREAGVDFAANAKRSCCG